MTTRRTLGLPTELPVPSATDLLVHVGSTIMQRIAVFLRRIGPRNDYRYGAGVIALGLAAFVLAGQHPYRIGPFYNRWETDLPLICFSGLLVIMGAYALPATNRGWYALKVLITAVAMHWMFVLPLERYWWQF